MSLISEHENYSKSNPSRKPYVTMVYDNGTMTCDCRGWTIKKKGKPRECTHTKKLAKKLSLVPSPVGEEMYYEGDLIPEGVVKAEPREVPDNLPVQRPNDGELEGMYDPNNVVQLKYDGTFTFLLALRGQPISMTGRSYKSDYTKNHPEMIADAEKIVDLEGKPLGIVLVGEFTFFDEDGQDHFLTALATENKWRELGYTAKFMVWDVLEMGWSDLRNEPYIVRYNILENLFADYDFEHFELVKNYVTNEEKDHAWAISTEGIIYKNLNALVTDGRTNSQRKVKKLKAEDFWCIGLTEGTGRREDTFGAMMFATLELGKLGRRSYNYLGNVGTGFNDDQLEHYTNTLVRNDDIRVANLPKKYMYLVEPLKIEVKYQRKTAIGKLIMPRFVKDRRDITG